MTAIPPFTIHASTALLERSKRSLEAIARDGCLQRDAEGRGAGAALL
jgi:hypothetical protein